MKGLLLKDYYIVKNSVLILTVVFIIIGASLSYLSTPWVLTVLATVLLGMIVTTTITLDKTSRWIKTVLTTRISRRTYVDSKYISYLGISLIGLVFGIVFGYIASTVIGSNNDGVMIFVCISVAMALLAGGIILPFYFLTDETKSILGSIISYPVSAGIFIGLFLLLGNHLSTYLIVLTVSLVVYIISWILTKKVLLIRDL